MNTSVNQILLIEDNEKDALLLEEALRRDTLNSFEFTVSERLETGLEALRTQRFDLILLDLGLPDSQGLATLEKVHAGYPDIPVVVLSGLMDDRLALEAVQVGAQDYLVKDPTSWEIAPRAIRYAMERQQAQATLCESEERFRTLIEQSSEGIVLVGETGDILEWNQAMEQITGIPRAQATTLPVWDLQLQMIPSEHRHPDSFRSIKALFSEVLKTGNLPREGNRFEIEIQTASGERKIVTQTIFAIKTLHGYRLGSIVLDITKSRQAEEALSEAHRSLAATMAAIPDLMFEMDAKGRILDYHAPDKDGLYAQKDTILGKTIEEVLPPDTVGVISRALAQAVIEGEHRGASYALNMPGGRRWFELSIAIKPGDSKHEPHFVTLARDITERRHAEESLRASETKYRKLFDEMSNGSALQQIICDDAGNPVDYVTLDVNAAFESLLGIKREQIIGRKASEILPAEELKEWLAIFGPTALTGKSTRYETYSPLNNRFFAGVAFSPAPGQFATTFNDVTEQKLAEERLNQNENRYRLATKATNDVIWEWDAKIHQLIWTENAQVVFGYSPEEIGPGEKWWDEHIHPDDRKHVTQKLDTLLAGDGSIWTEEYRLLLKDGSYADISDHAYVERDADGQPLRMIGAMSDITERKRAERLLTALNRSAAAMAHALTPDDVFSAASSQLAEAGIHCIVLHLDEDHKNYIPRYLSIGPALLHRLEKLVRIKHEDLRIPIELLDAFQKVRLENHAILIEDAEPAVRQVLPKPLKGLAAQIVRILRDPRYIAAPMKVDGVFVGIFSAQSNDLSERDLPAITAFADQMAISLRKAELFQQAQNEIKERKRAEQAIRLSEKKFKTLFEIAPVGISVLDRENKVIDANYALQMITGLKRNELLNGNYYKRAYLKPDGSLMTPDDFASTQALKEDMPIFDVETGIVTKNRGVVWTQVSAAPLNMPDAGLVVITQDISERKQAEQELHHRLAELETLYESGLSLNRSLEPKVIGQNMINVLAEKLEWNHTTIRLYHPESDELELLAYNIAGKTTEEEWQELGKRFKTLIARPGDGLSGWALQHGETVRCGDLVHDPRYIETVPGLRSGLYVPIQTGERVIGVISIESEKPDYFTAEDEHLAVTLAAQAAVAFENIRLFNDLLNSNEDLFRAYDETIEGWSHALDLRDKETEGHTQRVTTLTEELAREMGIPDTDMIYIRWGALLHDIGKMGVPDRILLKPDKLTDDEWVIMRQHPVHAHDLISPIGYLKRALNIPHYHHEKWDGTGYPERLKGEAIPLEARIFAVIDVFDALISDRPYRPGWPRDKAIRHIQENSGSHFDPQVVEVFLKLLKEK